MIMFIRWFGELKSPSDHKANSHSYTTSLYILWFCFKEKRSRKKQTKKKNNESAVYENTVYDSCTNISVRLTKCCERLSDDSKMILKKMSKYCRKKKMYIFPFNTSYLATTKCLSYILTDQLICQKKNLVTFIC